MLNLSPKLLGVSAVTGYQLVSTGNFTGNFNRCKIKRIQLGIT
jgi:hypothetical protein